MHDLRIFRFLSATLLKPVPSLHYAFGLSLLVVIAANAADSTIPVSTVFPVKAPSYTSHLIVLYLLICGAVFSAGAGNLFLFISRRKERAHLFLSITCLAVATDTALWLLTTAPGSTILSVIAKQFLLRMDFFAVLTAVGAGSLLMRSLYPLDYSRIFSRCIIGVIPSIALMVIVVPPGILTRLFTGFIVVVCLFIAHSCYAAVRAVLFKRTHSRLLAAASLAVFGAGAIDGLVVLRLLPPFPTLLPFGLAVFTHLIWFVVGRRHNEALLKSEKLQGELRRKARTERHLRMVQRRLSEFLDSLPLPVCALDEEGIIQFANSPVADRFAPVSAELTGQSIDRFLLPAPDGAASVQIPISDRCRDLAPLDRVVIPALLPPGTSDAMQLRLEMVPLTIEEEVFTILILHDTPEEPSVQSSPGQLLAELNRNRERLRELDRLVELSSNRNNPALLQELRAISSSLDHISHSLASPGSPDDRRELAREIMTHAVACWEKCTGMSRIELLRESELWRVETTPDGFERSKTLERYLDPRLFPKNPRWKKVLATGDYVLSRCQTPSEERTKLEAALSRLRLT